MKNIMWKKLKKRVVSRALPLFLAVLMVFPSAPITGISAGEDEGKEIYQSGQSSLVYDYDTLKLTIDGEEIDRLSIYPYEKIDVDSTGLEPNQNITYQWQIKHPEKNNLWVDIYDAKSDSIGVSVALINNMLTEDGTAALRLRAYTEDYAYLSNTLTVSIKDEQPSEPALSVDKITFPHAMAGDTSETPEFVTVTINYVRYDYYKNIDGDYVLDTSGTPAFTSYVATLLYGGSLENQKVTLPTIIGYNAFLCDHSTPDHSVDNNVGEIIKELTLNYTNITENITLQVDYLPADVNYSVRYFFQNIYDDLYIENTDEKVTTKGPTGSEPDEALMRKPFDGFTPLFHQPDTIAADGSTMFEVYYERNYYLMEFDCAGGYGVETLYVRYGSYISIPDPVKPGYVFAGWDLVKTDNPVNTEPMGSPVLDAYGNPTDFYTGDGHENIVYTEMPHYNTAYKALWDVADTTYTVVYWAENADDNEYSYWGYQTFEAKSAQTRSGVAYGSNTDTIARDSKGNLLQDIAQITASSSYFTYYPELTDKNVLIEGDGSSVVNVYYTRNVYTVEFTLPSTGTFTPPDDSHVHTDGNCGCNVVPHVHGPECVKGELICGLEEHSHTTCNLSCVHVHDSSCCDKGHTHSISCYTTQSTEQVGNSGDHRNRVNNISSPVAGTVYKYRVQYGWNTYYYYNYFYDGETWYYLGTGSTYAGMTGVNISINNWGNVTYKSGTPDRICGKEIHTHTDGTCNSNSCTHTHNDACYTCGNLSHTHTDSCYEWSCGETTHTHSPECCTKPVSYKNGNTYIIQAKYQQNVGSIWPTAADFSGYRLQYWDIDYIDNQATSKRVTMTEDLCNNRVGENRTLGATAHSASSSNQQTLFYMFESLKDSGGANGDERREYENTGVYYDLDTDYKQLVYSSATNWNQKPITGMTPVSGGIKYETSNTKVFFYYTRNRHTLNLYNVNVVIQSNTGVMFEQNLSKYKLTKEYMEENCYPSTYEPGAYEFGGWYTTPQCFKGTEVDWNKITMPDANLTLYAKWTPILRNVTFYTDYNDIPSATNPGGTPFLTATNVPHGSLLGTAYYEIPDKGGEYQFVGWFYMDENNKKRFAPDSMEITRDLVLFAEWQTGIDTEYEVQYTLGESATIGGTTYPAGTVIADTDAAHSSVGKTKTFNAKGAYQLYPAFRKSIFPKVNSHSILMEPNKNDNTFVFEYVYDDQVYYKVRYVDYSTRSEIADFKIKVTDEAIVTEKFLPISGYMPMPHNYYITKALMTDGDSDGSTIEDENVITFYYIKDTEHGLYSIEYYVENLDSSGTEITASNYETITEQDYQLHQSIVNMADLNAKITADIISIDGYEYQTNFVVTYDSNGNPKTPTTKSTVTTGGKTTITGTDKLEYTGLSIKIYYKRITYPYVIKFVDSYSHDILGYGKLDAAGNIVTNTDGTPKIFESINDINTDKAKFEDTIYYTAPATLSYGGSLYVLNGEASKDRKISAEEIPAGKTYNDLTNNVIVFYYNQKQVTVKYTAVCKVPGAVDFGRTSISSEVAATVSGLGGSEAIELVGYYFAGWFTHPSCAETYRIDDPSWVTDKKIKPQTLDQTKDVVEYYALFKPESTQLTIYKNGESLSEDDSFLFHIQGHDKFSYIDFIVSIQGTGSVVIEYIPQATYTITELTDWSFEYKPADGDDIVKTITLEASPGEVTFTNKPENSNWLNGETHEENVFNN